MAEENLNVCEELDRLTMIFFEKLEQLQSKRAVINEKMRDGNLNLSKSRYSMGNKNVGELQFSHKMAHALYRISVLEGNKEDDVFELEKHIPGKIIENEDIEDKEANGSTVRRRKIDSLQSKETGNLIAAVEDLDISTRGNEVKQKLENREKIEDPIKWFGVLVPSSLRVAQKNYQEVIELCCDVTNLEYELRQIILEFREMKAKKAGKK